jgi:hypothetical protein
LQDVGTSLVLGLLLGPDYLIYTAVSILAHSLKETDSFSISCGSSSSLFQQLLVQRSASFSPGDYLPFMDSLAVKYKQLIVSSLERHFSSNSNK